MLDAGDLVIMVRDDLTALPPVTVPPGYRLRLFFEGDERNWVQIQSAADRYNVITLDLFDAEFAAGKDELKGRQLYATDERGIAVGTVTAWLPETAVAGKWGRLHWLAVIPDRQHRGLGSALIAASLDRLRDFGCERVYLTSDSVRQEAIRLYERFGFHIAPADTVYRGR